MNETSVKDSDTKSTQRLLLVWAVCASLVALMFLGVLLSRQSRTKPAEVGGSSPTLPPKPRPVEITTTPTQLEPPPLPPLPEIYISDLQPLVFLSGWGQSGINRSVIGNPLALGGTTYERGLGTHANGEAVFVIPPDVRRFVAVVGLDDEVFNDEWGRGSVCFEVYGDLDEAGQPPVLLGKSPVLSPKTARTWALDVALEPRFRNIQLVVSDAGDGSECDHADWVNAGFLK